MTSNHGCDLQWPKTRTVNSLDVDYRGVKMHMQTVRNGGIQTQVKTQLISPQAFVLFRLVIPFSTRVIQSNHILVEPLVLSRRVSTITRLLQRLSTCMSNKWWRSGYYSTCLLALTAPPFNERFYGHGSPASTRSFQGQILPHPSGRWSQHVSTMCRTNFSKWVE